MNIPNRITREEQIQELVATSPWLLNVNYEPVPGLEGKGMELQLGDRKRADLILRDRVTRGPVIVEFKFVPFYRENIGQLMEYRARVISTYSKEGSPLYEVFGQSLLAPKLVLVVKECDDFSRTACNLSGIDVYEYRNASLDLTTPEAIEAVDRVRDILEDDPLPLKPGRSQEIRNRIYDVAQQEIEARGLVFDGGTLRRSDYCAIYEYADIFINRWFLRDQPVSLTIFEDIYNDFAIVIGFYSRSEPVLRQFAERYRSSFPGADIIVDWEPQHGEGFAKRSFKRQAFFGDVAGVFRTELDRYLAIRENLVEEPD